jgi:FkbM family methyltransferase
VKAVEPIPETFGNLKHNLALNGFDEQVDARCLGLSDQVSSLRFTARMGCVNHVLSEGEQVADSVEVPVTTMDALVGVDVPSLIKIDVEGHELAVLRGAERTLADSRLLAVIMETNGSGARYGIDDAELVGIMRANGFAPYDYDPFARRLVNADGEGGNTIFVRDAEAVSQRVATARRFKLVNAEI